MRLFLLLIQRLRSVALPCPDLLVEQYRTKIDQHATIFEDPRLASHVINDLVAEGPGNRVHARRTTSPTRKPHSSQTFWLCFAQRRTSMVSLVQRFSHALTRAVGCRDIHRTTAGGRGKKTKHLPELCIRSTKGPASKPSRWSGITRSVFRPVADHCPQICTSLPAGHTCICCPSPSSRTRPRPRR